MRPATGPTQLQVQAADGRGHFRALATVTTNKLGYWRLHSSFRAGRRWRVHWVSPSSVAAGVSRLKAGPPLAISNRIRPNEN